MQQAQVEVDVSYPQSSLDIELSVIGTMDENSNLLARGNGELTSTPVTTDDESTSEETKIVKDAKQLEGFLRQGGFGFFHVVLLLVIGLATAADAVEIFGVSFVVPIAEDDLELSTADKGWLDASIFIGMLIGSYLWGTLADAFGRKVTLMTAMLINGVCGLVSSMSPNFEFFLIFRLLSGIGVGGSQPIVFAYVSEFFTEKQRGPMIILLASCWQPGIIFTAFLAWVLLGIDGPHQGIDFYIGHLHFVPWRLFLILCTFPAFISSLSLIFMPESPAYLFHTKKIAQLRKVLKIVKRVNRLCPCCQCGNKDEEYLLDNEEVEITQSQETKTDLESETLDDTYCADVVDKHESLPNLRFRGKWWLLRVKMNKILAATLGLFRWNYLRATLLLLVIWFTQSFGYYGLQLWFPEYFKRLQHLSCDEDYVNTTRPTSCNETNLQFYQDTLYTAIASIPGNISGAILINIIGGRIQLAVAMVLSALSVFSIWQVPTIRLAVVLVSCVFSAVTVTVFGSLDVVVMNIYDVSLRSTGFGVHSGVGRFGAILGNVMFGHLLDVDRSVPILIVASFLSAGAIAAVFLPPIYRPENRPPLVRCLHYTFRKFKRRFKEHDGYSVAKTEQSYGVLIKENPSEVSDVDQ